MKKINVVLLFVSGVRLTNRNFLQFVRFNLLVLALIFFLSYIATIGAIKITYNRKLQEIIVLALSFPFLSYLFAGSIYYYLSFFKGITVRLSQIYMGFRWIINFLKYSFFILVTYQIVIIPLFTFEEYELEGKIRLLGGALFFFWFLIRSFFLPILFVDSSDNFEALLFHSLSLSKGYFAQIMLFILLALLVVSFGFLIGGFGVLYSISVVVLAYMKFYHVVKVIKNEKL